MCDILYEYSMCAYTVTPSIKAASSNTKTRLECSKQEMEKKVIYTFQHFFRIHCLRVKLTEKVFRKRKF